MIRIQNSCLNIFFILGLSVNLVGQVDSSSIYNVTFKPDGKIYSLNQLAGKLDRKPDFYRCSNAIRFSTSSKSLTYCISSNLRVQVENTDIENRNFIISYLPPSRKDMFMRTSKFNVVLDELGMIKEITTSQHSLHSVNENEIIKAIKRVEWKPAIKELKTVCSRFILVITFDSTIAFEEKWFKSKQELFTFLENSKNELKKTFIYDGGMYDPKITLPLLKLESLEELNEVLNELETKTLDQISLLDNEYISFVDKYEETDYELFETWKKQIEEDYILALEAELNLRTQKR